ncbi:GNVR domain-containing protein [Candidatus Neomarinimicrobiota bacterium]
MDEAIRILSDHITTTITEDNTLEISFDQRTDWFAFGKKKEEPIRLFVQQGASRIVQTLDGLNRRYLGQEAKQYREFIEERYKEISKDLSEMENRLTKFQKIHDVSFLDAQLQATLEAAALLEAEVVKQELEHALAKAKLSADSPLAENLDSELQAAKTAFERSLGGRNNEKRYLLGYDRNIPELMKEYLRLRREISIQSEVFKFIITKYEESKLREAQDTPTIMILDFPQTPDLRSAPRRAFMVITVGILMTVLAVILAFVFDFFRRIRVEYPEQYADLISGQ